MNKIGLLLCATLAISAAAPLTLVQDGKSNYSIVISTDASPSEKHGAQELQKFLEEMSGARLPVVTDAQSPQGNLVLVGSSKLLKAGVPFDSLGPAGFALKTDDKNLVIPGGGPRAPPY